MRSPVRRSLPGVAMTIAALLVVWAHEAVRAVHPHVVYFTGWSLLALTLCLAGYNARKKVPFLPLFTSRGWFLVHVYLGIFTGLVFLLHLRWRVPAGQFEVMLALLFTGVTLSGVIGWAISRVLPRRLTTAGGEIIYERIPVACRTLREEAESLVLGGIPAVKAATLAEFYALRLKDFFSGPANFWSHLTNSDHRINSLLDDLGTVSRFLKAEEKTTATELARLIRQKDALDYHRACQLVMKGWLFVHIPLTYALMIFTVVHVVLIYAFAGGAR